jgi:hypothetical protein
MNYFLEELLSILISKKIERIESIDQLLDKKEIKLLVEKNSVPYNVLKNV